MLYLCSGHISIISCPTNAGLLSVYNLFSAKKRGGPEKSSQNCLFPAILSFYKRFGFEESHRIKNFFIDHYDHPMFEENIQLIDMIYLKKDLLES